MDAIQLRGLRAVGVHGLLPEERDRPQPFELDIDVEGDFSMAAATDDLADTADYGALTAMAARVVTEESYRLLERLAGRVAEVILAADDRVAVVAVTVWKLRPPVPVDLDRAGVRVTRRRGER